MFIDRGTTDIWNRLILVQGYLGHCRTFTLLVLREHVLVTDQPKPVPFRIPKHLLGGSTASD